MAFTKTADIPKKDVKVVEPDEATKAKIAAAKDSQKK